MDLVSARARIHAMLTDPDGTATDELDRRLDHLIEAARTPEPAYTSNPLPPRDAICVRPGCGHTGEDHHHGDTKCWANLPRTRQPNGTWSAVPICYCDAFQAS
ncbi:hypothetical protein P1P75_40310 [Streptomyces sp. ID05-39B]|uniref:hypothetical protein n=1 Tax=Streptomyces sp. ID05-39B TaxID=3028664 RepID=UPI0029A8062F|nr:hypothetical protein [Streptomyces sp. ID05-39B]MDX3532475.1 hypothetical protein [Streptomyces sp. ID05-39B]